MIAQNENHKICIDFSAIDTTKIKTKKYVCDNQIYKYYNNRRNDTDPLVAPFKSIITDENDNIMCFAPPTTTEFTEFIKKHDDAINNNIYINELIEGTMINLFYDVRNDSWEISTRSTLKANNWYYRTNYDETAKTRQKSFRQMFLEEFTTTEETEKTLNAIFAEYDKNYTYSFVMMHPDNHMVLNVQEPRIYLVSVYKIVKPNMVFFVSPIDYENWSVFMLHPQIHFPYNLPLHDAKHTDNSLSSLCNCLANHTAMGLVVTDLNTGERTILIKHDYEWLKVLRGNHVNLEFHYHVLRRQTPNHLNEFLSCFPRYASIFAKVEAEYNEFIKTVQNYYYKYFVKKDKSHIPKKYFIHVAKLHNTVFIPCRMVVTLQVVKDYFDAMTPKMIYMFMHYDENRVKPRLLNIVNDVNDEPQNVNSTITENNDFENSIN